VEMQDGAVGRLNAADKKKPLREEWVWEADSPQKSMGLRKKYFDNLHSAEEGNMRFDQTYERMRSACVLGGHCGATASSGGGVFDVWRVREGEGRLGVSCNRGTVRAFEGRPGLAIDIAGPFEKTPEGYTHFLLAWT